MLESRIMASDRRGKIGRHTWLLRSAIVVCLASSLEAQTIIDASRRVDWSQAGISEGIPPRTTICATLGPAATAAQINSAIAACTGGVVYLGAGTYTLSAGIDFAGKSNVT
jgi:polygalacturonase